MTGTPIFPLAACSEMLFRDLPYLDRVRRIHELGFQVEMWDWTGKDIDAVAATAAYLIASHASGRPEAQFSASPRQLVQLRTSRQ